MIIQEEWESVIAEFQEAHGELDPAIEKIGEECFHLGCAFMYQILLQAFQDRSYQTLALLKDELLTYHEEREHNGPLN